VEIEALIGGSIGEQNVPNPLHLSCCVAGCCVFGELGRSLDEDFVLAEGGGL